MSAGVSPVPDEAVEEFARGVYGTQWPMLNPKVQEEILTDYRKGLAAALPALREGIAAEVLAPVRAELSRSFAMSAVSSDPHLAWRDAVAYVRDDVLRVIDEISPVKP